MIILGILFPLFILLATKSLSRSWRVLRLFTSYLVIYSLAKLAIDYFGLNPWVSYFLLFMVGIAEGSNLEHVINNNANQNFIFIKFIFDPVFLKGSGITKRFLFRLFGIQATVALVCYLDTPLDLTTSLIILAVSAIMSLLLKISATLPNWLQEHWIFFNLKNVLGVKKVKKHNRLDVTLSVEKLKAANLSYDLLRPQELGDHKWLKSSGKPNVLILVVEGLGEVHFKKGWVPKLAQRRQKSISLKRFINHQRNTNRGLYSIFSGKHPNMLDQSAQSDLVAQYGKMDQGLADVLVDHGYHTVFIQGAPSIFMYKDRFMPLLGFQEVIGEEKYPASVPRIKWGVDDQQLYKMAMNKIEEMNAKSQPWMLSTLTLSTHHPIEASNRVLKSLEDGFRYADDELDDFLNELDRKGILDSTVVYITSDEVAGDGQHVLAESLGSMLILTPDKLVKEIGPAYNQTDLAFSVCDYLNIDDHQFGGRSFFRDYASSRPLYFASIFQQKVFMYVDKKLLIQHYSGKKEMIDVEDLTLESKTISAKDLDEASFEKLAEFLKASDRGLDFLTRPIIMDLKELKPNGDETVKTPSFIKVGLKKGESIRLKFQGENYHPSQPLVVNWLIQDMKHKRSFKPNVIILPGIAQEFEKDFISPGDSWYDLSIRVMANENHDWLIKDLQISPIED